MSNITILLLYTNHYFFLHQSLHFSTPIITCLNSDQYNLLYTNHYIFVHQLIHSSTPIISFFLGHVRNVPTHELTFQETTIYLSTRLDSVFCKEIEVLISPFSMYIKNIIDTFPILPQNRINNGPSNNVLRIVPCVHIANQAHSTQLSSSFIVSARRF